MKWIMTACPNGEPGHQVYANVLVSIEKGNILGSLYLALKELEELRKSGVLEVTVEMVERPEERLP